MGKHRWKGELAKPIRLKVIRPQGLRVTAKTARAANKQMEDLYRQAIENEYLAKLELLMDEYGITDKTDFSNLALALAIEHVPGFRIDPTPLRLEQFDDQGIQVVVQDNREGRKPKWSLKRRNDLRRDVEEKNKNGLSDHEALSILVSQRAEWARPPNHRGGLEAWRKTLKNQLAVARHFSKNRSNPKNKVG